MKKRRSDSMAINDDWTMAAMDNDFIVADLLLQIKHSNPSLLLRTDYTLIAASFATLRWGVRRPRSRSVLRNEAVSSEKNNCEFTRFSPTTPLSWSGGSGGGNSSPSDTVERFREVKQSRNARSNKVFPTNDDATTSISTRSRKRKTVAALKEEESTILIERKRLKKEFETLQATVNDQKARNRYLKRLKVECDEMYRTRQTASTPYEHKPAYSNYSYQIEASTFTKAPSLLPAYVPSRQFSQTDLFQVEKRAATKERYFMLPDLNSLPYANDSCCSETLYGLS